MPNVIILSGADRYDGRHHDHAATSQRIAGVLAEAGIDARIRAMHPRVAPELATAGLLIANIANGEPGPDDRPDEEWQPAWDALRAHIAANRPLLTLHLAAGAKVVPEWRQWIGGEWVHGTSMHPAIAESTVTVATDTHPIVQDFRDFTLYDEMYSYLTVEAGSQVLVTHHFEGQDHALVWAVEDGERRAVYDAFGHGWRAYDSPQRNRLLQREALWLLGQDEATITAR